MVPTYFHQVRNLPILPGIPLSCTSLEKTKHFLPPIFLRLNPLVVEWGFFYLEVYSHGMALALIYEKPGASFLHSPVRPTHRHAYLSIFDLKLTTHLVIKL